MADEHETTPSTLPESTSHAVGDNSGLNGYADGSGEQTNSANSSQGLSLPTDDQDSASILESLLNFNAAKKSHEIQDQPNDQFQGLLNAVASANAQGQARSKLQDQFSDNASAHGVAEHEDRPCATATQDNILEHQDHIGSDIEVQETIKPQDLPASSLRAIADSFFVRSFEPENPSSKRERGDDQQNGGQRSAKRNQMEHALAEQRETWGPEVSPSHSSEPSKEAPAREDARLMGVAVLFKRSTPGVYNRGNASKVFFDLELGCDEFVQIQAAAKQYMLDPSHPDRQQCVNADRYEASSTRLKMWETCTAFLQVEGWGECLWGANAPHINEPERTLKWPKDKNKIIKKLIPLLRRQITNEKSRKSMIEKRKQKKTPQQGSLDLTDAMSFGSPQPLSELGSGQAVSSLFDPFVDSHAADPNVDQYHYSREHLVQQNIHPENGEGSVTAYNEGPHNPEFEHINPNSYLKYYVNILHGGRRAFPRLDLAPHNCFEFADLTQHIRNYIGDDGATKVFHIKVQLPNGMFTVFDENSWRHATEMVMDNDWMDGEARFLVTMFD